MGRISRRSLFGLLLAFGLLGLVYSLSTPLFEAPDEPWHFAYVRWLAEGHGLPRLDDDTSGANQEVAQPPLYYAVAALANNWVADDDLAELFWHNPQFGFQAGGTVNDNKNMLIHTDREGWPWRGVVLAVRLARFVSLAFGVLAVGATYGLAREALPHSRFIPLLAAGVVALTPQFLFISGVVSNDSAAAATCTIALWALARLVRLGPTRRRAAVAGVALGLALLSKTSALLLLPMALLALAFGHRVMSRDGNSRGSSLDDRRAVWQAAVLILGLALLVGGWWYARNWILFDDPLGLSVHVNTPWGRAETAGLRELLSELPQVFRSFWGAFGWGHVELPGFVYAILGLLVILSLVGWFRQLLWLRGRRPSRGKPTPQRDGRGRVAARGPSSVYVILGLAAAWCLVVLLALLRWMQQVEAPHGRLLFPALGGWGLLLVIGWSGLSPGRPVLANGGTPEDNPPYVVGAISVAGLLFLSLVAPYAVIRPAFAPPELLSPQQAAQRVTQGTLVYGERARLLGYRVAPETVKVGEQVQVTLCWEALHEIQEDYALFIHLLGRDNARVGERTTYPGQGRFPTSLWPVGRAFCDSYGIEVASWAAAPELYELEVGLYDGQTGWRLPAQDAAGQPVAPPTVGWLRVVDVSSPPLPERLLSYDLGGQIVLLGYDSEQGASGGEGAAPGEDRALTLTLYWQALQEPEGDYKVFVHLLDGAGGLVAQDDGVPRQGRYPTWAWRPGDIVPDVHQVLLPDDRPPGPYSWLVGMYEPDSRDRLPVVGSEGPLPDNAIRLEEDVD